MERIKKALDKARKERESQAPTATVTVMPHVETEPGIQYTRTRSIKIANHVLKEHRVITGNEQEGSYGNAYKILRTRVLRQMADNGWNTLAITSPNENAGKTQTAINLAISTAMEVTKTVLLVDADLRRPSVHKFFGLQPALGLNDYLTGDVPLEEILINPGIERFVLLPTRRPLANSSEMLASPKMEQLVQELKQRYPSRIVLFDLPPVLSVDDVLAFSPFVDAALVVIEEGRTQKEELVRTVELLQDTVNIIGTILNKSQTSAHNYYY